MNNDENFDIEKHYAQALQFTESHYENFPVVSIFVKKNLRKHVAAIYQFARQADDLADEGKVEPQERIKDLEAYELNLKKSLDNKSESGFWKILNRTVKDKSLSENNFYDLLSAFKQDVEKKRYENYDELLCYCKRSANPVGRLILELHGITEEEAHSYSDKICTALQLTNFYQDVSVDILKERIYLPEDERKIFEVSEFDIANKRNIEQFIRLMKYQVERTKNLFNEGKQLLTHLPFRLKIQILVTIKGGEAILRKIEEANYNVLEYRPTLSKIEFIKLFLSSLFLWR